MVPGGPTCRGRGLGVLTDARLLLLAVPGRAERLAVLVGEPPLDRDDVAPLLAASGISLLPPGWAEMAA